MKYLSTNGVVSTKKNSATSETKNVKKAHEFMLLEFNI